MPTGRNMVATVVSVVIAPRHHLLSHESRGLEIGPYRQWAMQDCLKGEERGPDLKQSRGPCETLPLPLGTQGMESFGWNRFKMKSPALPKNTLDG